MAKNGIKLSYDKVKSLYDFYLLVSSENQKYNLTSITEKQDFYTKHILDSLIAKDFFAGKGKVVDLGSGGGFPAIPIKIYNPDLDVHSWDLKISMQSMFELKILQRIIVKSLIFAVLVLWQISALFWSMRSHF